MHTAGGLFIPDEPGLDVTPRYKNVAGEEEFLHEYARYSLHKRLQTEGMISLCANNFYPQMHMTSNTTENDNVRRNLNIDKNEIARQLNKIPENIVLREDIKNAEGIITKE